MIKVTTAICAVLCLFPSWRCAAQEVVPVFQLSAAEMANAHKAAQNLKNAQDRSARVRQAWRAFYQTYQTEHPELSPNLRFASDFRMAFTSGDSGALDAQPVRVVELTVEEQHKGVDLYREATESEKALIEAQKNWMDYKNQLAANHIANNAAGEEQIRLPGGRTAVIPAPWNRGIGFTPDFRFAVPLN